MRGRVLIADPDRNEAVELAEALTEGGYEVGMVGTGEEIMGQLAGGGVEVLISQVHLPDGPVWSFLTGMRRCYPEITVVTITDDDSWETSRRVRVEGGPIFFYELKPIDLQRMCRVVDCAFNWRGRRYGEEQVAGQRMVREVRG